MNNFCFSNPDDIDFLKEAFNILSEPNRIKIICLLGTHKTLCVCEIIERLGIKQNLVSHHLSMFKRIGLVDTKRCGTNIYYTINPEKYARLRDLVGVIFHF